MHQSYIIKQWFKLKNVWMMRKFIMEKSGHPKKNTAEITSRKTLTGPIMKPLGKNHAFKK